MTCEPDKQNLELMTLQHIKYLKYQLVMKQMADEIQFHPAAPVRNITKIRLIVVV